MEKLKRQSDKSPYPLLSETRRDGNAPLHDTCLSSGSKVRKNV